MTSHCAKVLNKVFELSSFRRANFPRCRDASSSTLSRESFSRTQSIRDGLADPATLSGNVRFQFRRQISTIGQFIPEKAVFMLI